MGHNTKTANRAAGIIDNRAKLGKLAKATEALAKMGKTEEARLDAAKEDISRLYDLLNKLTIDVFNNKARLDHIHRRSLAGRLEALREWVARDWRFIVKHIRRRNSGIEVTVRADDGTIYIDGDE